MIRAPLVAISVVSSVAPTGSTAQQSREVHSVPAESPTSRKIMELNRREVAAFVKALTTHKMQGRGGKANTPKPATNQGRGVPGDWDALSKCSSISSRFYFEN